MSLKASQVKSSIMCRVQILILLLALVKIPLPIFGYSIDDNRIDVHDVAPTSNGGAVTHVSKTIINHQRRIFELCPPHFHHIGNECYLISDVHRNWLGAHFYCKEKNSKLAEPQKKSDRFIREYLLHHFPSHIISDPMWIGATYDWNKNVWQWGINAKNLKYQAFEFMKNGKNLENHCAMYSPATNYRWSAAFCTEKQRFICQHKMVRVSGRNLHNVYEHWNATYPHEYANERIAKIINRKKKNSKNRNRRLKSDARKYQYTPTYNRTYTDIYHRKLNNNHINNLTDRTTTVPATILTTHRSTENEVVRPKNPMRQQTEHDRRVKLGRQKERKLNQMRKLRKGLTRLPQIYEINKPLDGKPRKTQTEKNDRQQLSDEEDSNKKNEKLQVHYLNKQKEAEQRELIEREYEKQKREKAEREEAERLIKENQLKLEYEEMVKRAQVEQEKLRERELKIKQMRDEENRRLYEQQENERIAREKTAEMEEELRRQQENLENARRLEQEERERLQREQELHEEQERKVAEKLRKLEEVKRRQEAEEAVKAEKERQEQQQQEEMEKRMTMTTTPEPETTISTKKLEAMESSRRIAEDELARKAEEKKRRNYAERIMRLTPEQQIQFLAERRRRKINKKNRH